MTATIFKIAVTPYFILFLINPLKPLIIRGFPPYPTPSQNTSLITALCDRYSNKSHQRPIRRIFYLLGNLADLRCQFLY